MSRPEPIPTRKYTANRERASARRRSRAPILTWAAAVLGIFGLLLIPDRPVLGVVCAGIATAALCWPGGRS